MHMKVWSICLMILLTACTQSTPERPVVEVETRFGNFKIELYAKEAPHTVQRFLEFVERGYYKRASFYRILNEENQPSNTLKAYVIQGGIWESNPLVKDTLTGIPHESTASSGILHTTGTISMARLEPGTATTEFFICLQDQPGYDFGGANNEDGEGYAAFGKIIEGFDVVRKIYKQPEHNQSFTPSIMIFNIRKV